LRRYILDPADQLVVDLRGTISELRNDNKVRRCRLTVSEPVLKAPMVSANLEYYYLLSTFAYNLYLRRYNKRLSSQIDKLIEQGIVPASVGAALGGGGGGGGGKSGRGGGGRTGQGGY
jgi:uncharacterized membrane protein